MTPESTLPVIAQIAATFAGFTALVSVVDQGQDGRWARISIWRIRSMLRTSLTLLFLCLLPAILLSLDIPPPVVWKTAIGTVLFTGGLNWFSSMKMTRQLSPKEGPSLNQTVRKINISLGFSGLGLQAVALTGVLPLNLSGVYLLSMVLNLMIASLVFFALVQQLDLQRLENEEKPVKDKPEQSLTHGSNNDH